MSELPVPAVTPPDTPVPQTLVCANCHERLNGEYCSACGQRHEPHIHTVAHFAGEAFESISHADSRLWRTLGYLLSRPGHLTREFFAGRRVRYLPPFRLYLVISVVFFLLVGLGGGDNSVNVGVEPPDSPEDIAAMNAAADELESGNLGPMSEEQRAAIAQQLRSIAAEGAAEVEDRGTGLSLSSTPPRTASEAVELDLMTGEGVRDGMNRFCSDFRDANPPGQELTARQRSVLRWCSRFEVDGMGAVGHALAQNIPRAMFLFLPLLALCMKAIYWRPKRYYVEHLLFMVHNHAFVFLVVTLCMLFGMIPYIGKYGWILNWAAFFYMAWYIYRAMRNVYGQSRGLTIAKYLLMFNVYIAAALAIFLLTLIFSALMY